MSEVDRLRATYARRAEQELTGRYAGFDPAILLLVQEREQAVLGLLRRYRLLPLEGKRVLDVGCGTGGELRNLLRYGTKPVDLLGIDLLSERLEKACQLSPNLHFACASADALPCLDEFFDLVIQFTVFTSILDCDMRRRVAKEMLRVLKPRGLILWYDFWINPINPDVRPIKRQEIAQLFPHCRLDWQRVTLAPPIARRLARLSRLACHLLGKIPWLRTHYLVAVTKRNAQENI